MAHRCMDGVAGSDIACIGDGCHEKVSDKSVESANGPTDMPSFSRVRPLVSLPTDTAG
jgi:hypothetical protein